MARGRMVRRMSALLGVAAPPLKILRCATTRICVRGLRELRMPPFAPRSQPDRMSQMNENATQIGNWGGDAWVPGMSMLLKSPRCGESRLKKRFHSGIGT